MTEAFEPLYNIPLETETTFDRPSVPPELVHLDSPALDVFTDFRVVKPVTVAPYVPIDAAVEMMKSAGVRLLLVTNGDEKILGIVTASDITGEDPINLIHEMQVKRSEISVEMLMTPRSAIRVLNMLSVEGAQVGHIVETLHRL
jgi:CBS domain containing-hemolysin-like protein